MNAGIETFEGGDAEAATTVGTSTVESGTSRVGERSARVAIVGGGTGGVAVAAALRRALPADDAIVLIEPGAVHHYQPGLTLVGGGVWPLERTQRPRAESIPPGVTWVRECATAIDPAHNRVRLADGGTVGYDWLVVAVGLELAWDQVPGLAEALGDGRVCSIYSPDTAADTWMRIRGFEGGRALFTQPPMPIKCPGAPQKIVYLAADHWRRAGVLATTRVGFRTATPSLFSVAEYVPTLEGVAARYGVDVEYGARLTAVDGPNAVATFERTGEAGTVERWSERYDLLHAVPPQGPVALIADGGLGDADGWLDIDAGTMQHQQYPNVFGIGDATSAPTSKTAAAVRAQLPVVVANLLAAMDGAESPLRYNGYASCPLITARGKVVLAEFVYGRKLAPTLPWDSTRERRTAWWLKTRFIPWMYWNRLLKGRDLPGTEISRQLALNK